MENNYIKDNRNFPEEMHKQAPTPKKESSSTLLWWVLGLLVLLIVVFYLGLVSGKNVTNPTEELPDEEQALVEERQEAVVEQQTFSNPETPEEREDRVLEFFNS